MAEIEIVSDHGLEVLKKSATILDDSKKTVYNIRTLSTYSGSNLFQPVPDQYDDIKLSYDVEDNLSSVEWYYLSNLIRTATLTYDVNGNLEDVAYS